MVHPLVPLSLYFCTLFFDEAIIPGVPVSANQLLAPLFFFSFASYWFRGRTLKLQSSLLPVLLVVAVYFAVSAISGESFERGVLHCRYVIVYLLLAYCLARSLSTEGAISGVCWLVTGITLIAAGAGLYEAINKNILSAFSGKWTDAVRVKGYARNSIVFGWNMVFAFPFSFYHFSQSKNQSSRITALGAGLIILLVAVLTFNRQTFVAIAVLMVCAAIFFQYENRRLLLVILSAAAAVCAVSILPLIVARLFTVHELRHDISFLERRDQFLLGVEMFRRHPLTGVGLGSYPAIWRNYIPTDFSTYFVQYQEGKLPRYPDFGYLALLAETGIIGFILYVSLLLATLFRAWELRAEALVRQDKFAVNLCALLLVLVIFMGISSAIQDTFLYVRQWMFFGMALLLDQRILFPREQSYRS
jgi:O-antigen ligase